uniref:Uncharacterized protein n=1 Tax=Magnetococcus massalia (strain MO-1) TaxID=451514 RepID=A0A1S7LI55_MAGMO|nr:Conserved protein of unknown function [Candidatus Magnetococcus massalia]
MVERCPPGFVEHLTVFYLDLCRSQQLSEAQQGHFFACLVHRINHWCGPYPDPTLLVWLEGMRCFKPDDYAAFCRAYSEPLDERWLLGEATRSLTVAIHGALTRDANPMRMREDLWEAEEDIEAFFKTHHYRFIIPFDGRSTEEIYSLCGHVEDMIHCLDQLEVDKSSRFEEQLCSI